MAYFHHNMGMKNTFFDLQGHRGARGLWPENTLPAYQAALRIGVCTLELDVGISSDGVVVVSHDRALNPEITRDAQGQWIAAPILVNSLSCKTLQSFDVGRINPASAYAQRFAQQTPLDGTRMPTLAQVFETFQSTALHFNIETKISPDHPYETVSPETFVNALLAVVHAHGMADRVIVQSFDWRTLALVQQLAPGVRTACLTAQQPWTDNITPQPGRPRWTGLFNAENYPDVPSMVRATGASIWSPYFGDLSVALVTQAQSLGLQVIPWTVNTAAELTQVIGMGVNGLISDYPDLAVATLNEKGIALVRVPPDRA